MPRVLITGAYNTRAGSIPALTGRAGIMNIGILDQMVLGGTTLATEKDRRFVNCYVQSSKDEVINTVVPYCVKRPGFTEFSVPAAGVLGNAIHVWVGQGSGSKVISAFGGANSTIYDSTTALGTITGLVTRITETTISGVPTLTFTSTDNTGWYYPEAGALTKITDADFPGNAGVVLAGHFVHIGGICYVMGANGYIYNSDVNSLTEWTGSNKYATNSYPDKGIGCIRRGEYVVAFGTQSFEVLKNANVPPPGSPLARIPDSTQQVGALSAQSILNVRDVIYWVGGTRQGSVSVYGWKGGEAQVISNPSIDAQLKLAAPAEITLSSASIYGNTHVYVRAGNITYVYCVEEQNWWEMSSQFVLWDRMDSVSIGNNIVNYSVSTTLASGKVYVLNPLVVAYTDDTIPYTALIQTGANDFSTSKRKAFKSLEVVADQEAVSSPLAIFWSDDDYENWNEDPRTVDLHNHYRMISRLGSSRRRAFKLAHSAPTGFRIQALDVEIDKLTA